MCMTRALAEHAGHDCRSQAQATGVHNTTGTTVVLAVLVQGSRGCDAATP